MKLHRARSDSSRDWDAMSGRIAFLESENIRLKEDNQKVHLENIRLRMINASQENELNELRPR